MQEELPHLNLAYNPVISKVSFLNSFYRLVSLPFSVELLSSDWDECHRTPLVINHWLCRHLASLGHDEINPCSQNEENANTHLYFFKRIQHSSGNGLVPSQDHNQCSTLRRASVPWASRSFPRAHTLLWLRDWLGTWFFSQGMYLFFQQYT